MKIKDIINRNWGFKTRLLVARRINKCSKATKRSIVVWKRTGQVTNRKLSLQVNGRLDVIISIMDLIDTYGMDPLSAMLFFDDLIKANNAEDKSHLINLIRRIEAGQKGKSLKLPHRMEDKIKFEQPELWAEYLRIKNSNCPDKEKAESECEEISEIEIEE